MDINPTSGVPKTSYGPKDSPSVDNATWFSTLQKDDPNVMDDREFRTNARIDKVQSNLEKRLTDLEKEVKSLRGIVFMSMKRKK